MQEYKETIKRVAMSIPTEGHTLPEAYDNHLLHAQRMGGLEARQKYENKLYRIMKKYKLNDKEFKGIKFHKVAYEFYWFTTGRLLTQLAREKLAENAVDGGMDYIIMFDDDQTLPPNFAQDMLETMEKNPHIDVLGALAFMRNAPHYPVIYSTIEGYDPVSHTEYYRREFVKRYPKDSLVECDAVGFGGVCIKVELLKKLKAPWFMSTTATGEDIWFCYRAKRDANARIFMDTRIKLGHLKNPEIIDEEGFERYIKESKHDLGDEVPNKYLSKAK